MSQTSAIFLPISIKSEPAIFRLKNEITVSVSKCIFKNISLYILADLLILK